MDPYAERVTRFFLQSLHTLKKGSGNQRWNDLCNDTIELAFHIAPKYFPVYIFSKDSLWQLFFYPPTTLEDSVVLVSLASQQTSPDFLFTLLKAFTDPPKSWWDEQV